MAVVVPVARTIHDVGRRLLISFHRSTKQQVVPTLQALEEQTM